MRKSSIEAGAADRLDLPARAVLYGAGALAVIAGPVLFFLPRETASYFAWEIANPLTPVFLGANYLSGIGAVWAARSGSWAVARVIMPAVIVFSTTQLVATVFHLDIFNWSHPVAWAWLAVYIVSPLTAISASLQQERRWRQSGRNAVVGGSQERAPFLIASGLYLVVGLALFVAPERVAADWPWSLTPLTGRVIGGWILSGAFLYWMLAREPVLERARNALISIVIVMGLLLVGAALQGAAFDGPALSLGLYIVYLVSFGAVALASLMRLSRGADPSEEDATRSSPRDGLTDSGR